MQDLTTVATPEDYEAWIAVYDSRLADYHLSVRELMSLDESVRSGGRRSGRVLVFRDGRAVAAGFWSESVNYFVPGRFMLNVVVHPGFARRGLGTELHDALVSITRGLGLTELAAHVCDHDPSGPAFARNQGYQEAAREQEMRVDPRTIDPAAYAERIGRLRSEGVSFVTLPELKARDSGWLDRIYTLYTQLDGATPSPVQYVPPPVEILRRTEIEPVDGVPEAFYVALQGSEWIGLSEVRRSEEGPHPLRQGLTGVLPAHRGRGIATALKVHVLEWVRRNDFRSLRTWNDATNAPMLHVNESMGFRLHANWILYRKMMENRSS